jgi:Ca2+-binding EF-hand superfamily protein
MRRVLFGSGVVLTLVLGGVLAAQNQTGPNQKNPSDLKKQDDKKEVQHPFRVDIDRLLKEYDKNGDGHLQREEVPAYLRDHFDQIDTNKDGKLSRAELEKGAAFLQAKRRPSDMVFILIEMSDCDECCAEELQRIYDVLRKLDKSNSGKIDAASLKTIRQELVEERVDHIFKELDINKDGKIARDEARGAIKTNFDQLDTNKDGFIDRTELLRAASERILSKKDKEK